MKSRSTSCELKRASSKPESRMSRWKRTADTLRPRTPTHWRHARCKLLDEKITVEGLFSIVLRTRVTDGEYLFSTKNSGQDTVKSPIGLFDTDTIPNDLAAADAAICAYYNLTTTTE